MPDPEPIKEEPKEETPPEITEPVKEEEKQETPKETVDFEKRYKDLQKAYNKRDIEVTEYKQNLENWKKLGTVIENDPELFNSIKNKLGTGEPAKPNGQAKDDTKLFMRDQIIDRFETRYRIKELEPEKAEELRKKIGSQIQFMMKGFAGEGEDLNDTMLKVPLNELPMYFENAYRLAVADDNTEQARLRGIMEAQTNSQGMIGSIPSSSAKTDNIVLTDKQKEAAKKLGIKETDYVEYIKKEQNG